MSGSRECEHSSLESSLGYRFSDPSLLRTALTHTSFVKGEHRSMHGEHNERLEFLGDAILQLVVSAYLYKTHPELQEGGMTRMRSSLVREEGLYRAACALGIPDAILLGRGEELTGGRRKPSIVSDAMEAVIGAVTLDGGMDAAVRLILGKIVRILEDCRMESSEKDFKTKLQEYAHKARLGGVTYVLAGTEGPEHDKTFLMEALIGGERYGRGGGRNKQDAGQKAAEDALSRLNTSAETEPDSN